MKCITLKEQSINLIAQLVKNLPARQETLVPFLGQEDLLEKGYATHSRILGLPLWLSWSRIHLQSRRPRFNSWVKKIHCRRDRLPTPVFLGFPGGSDGKESACTLQHGRPRFDPWVGKMPWRRERLPTPVFWPGEFHGLYV